MINFRHLNKYVGVLLLLLFHTVASSQTLKSGVLVIGASPSGIAAAIQAAHSGVKTVLLDEGSSTSVVIKQQERENPSGVVKDLLSKIEDLQKYPVKSTQALSLEYVATILKGWTDTIKNLTVIRNSAVSGIKKSGKGWEVQSSKAVIKADIIVDATAGRKASAIAGLKDPVRQLDSLSYLHQLYRTSVTIPYDVSVLPATTPAKFFLSSLKNFVYAWGMTPGETAGFSTGQAAGAIAAYCSFFNTTTDKLNIRLIQSELMTYRSRLIGFADIVPLDSNSLAIQQLALTGIIKGKVRNGQIYLLPDSSVSTEDIRLPVKEYYSRSQIWFLDNKSDKMTMEQLLSLIKFTAQRGSELDKEIEKGWKISFKLPGEFNSKRQITRREFAVLFNSYLRPFDVSVDINGQLKR